MSLATTLAAASATTAVDHVEPPHWWVGMKNSRVQLMLHGAGIATSQVQIQGQGVSLAGSHALQSPNYLFVDLDIAANAPAQQLAITLTPKSGAAQQLSYELKARRAGSAERKSFGREDAIYLVVPDRFARADSAEHPAEDKGGLFEGRDRSFDGGRHGGNLRGLTQHLDYIAGMGFTQIWSTPIVENNSEKWSYHGYAATDFYRVDPRLGTLADYRELSAQGRARGVGLIHDVVLNHIGINHWWMKDLPSSSWLNRIDPEHFVETHHARVSIDDPHAAPSDAQRFTDGWFAPYMPDLNQRCPEVATYLTQMVIWWVEEVDLSGLRVDTYSYSDRDFTWAWNRAILNEYPHLNLVGEEWSPHPPLVARWQKSAQRTGGSPSMMDFPLQGAVLASLSEGDSNETGLMRLYETLGLDFVYPDASNLVVFTGNHDTPRTYSLLREDLNSWKMAMAYLSVVQRIPQFFYGDELLFTSPRERADGVVRADFPGGFEGDAINGFTGAGVAPKALEAQGWLRKLLNWRKGSAVIRDGALMHYAPVSGVYVMFRYTATGKVMLVLNKNKAEHTLDAHRFKEMLDSKSQGTDVITGAKVDLGGALKLPARSVMVIELSK